MATGSTGKSLGSYAGAAILFADRHALQGLDRNGVPSYLDIAAALDSDGPCYTFPSPTLRALEAAVEEYAGEAKAKTVYHRYHELGVRIRRHLNDLGFRPLAKEEVASPVITTFAPPDAESSAQFVQHCQSWGFTIGGESAYLSQRRLVQMILVWMRNQHHVRCCHRIRIDGPRKHIPLTAKSRSIEPWIGCD